MEAKISQEEIMQLLDKLYDQSVHGIVKVSPPIDKLAMITYRKAKTLIPLRKGSLIIKLQNAQLLDS